MNNQLFYLNNGSFRILVLADIQENRVLTEAYKKKLLSIIDETHPQLIVLLGDMIFGPVMFTKKRAEKVIHSIVDLLNRAIKRIRKLVTFHVHTLRIGNRILVDREQLDQLLHDEDREILI